MSTATLNNLKDNQGARKKRKIVGRGIGSGKGKTCGRGMKGQKSRSGVAIKGFEGGQMPIYRRLPKRGFTNTRRKEFQAVNIAVLQDFIDRKKLDASKTVTTDTLLESGVLTHLNTPVKILAKGQINTKLTIEVNAASKTAIAAIEKVGGKVVIVEAKKVIKKKSEQKVTSDTKETKKSAKSEKAA